jgi:hypothetical protein
MTTPGLTGIPHARQRRLLAIVLGSFWLPALVVSAQPAIYSGANTEKLPLRNIQIEVRQVQQSLRDRADQQNQQSSSAQQTVLVLNGRSAAIALRNITPFRLMQTQFRNGMPIQVPGVVLLDASTGFSATPRWDGSDVVELELSATQASAASLRGRGMPPASTSSASTLMIPVGEWVTVAQSDLTSQSSISAWGAQSAQSIQQSSELQVRLTVR